MRLIPVLLLLIFIFGCSKHTETLSGNFVGVLNFPTITYQIYLNAQGETPVVMNATFKAKAFELDTIWFKDDSLYFQLKEFYSVYKGHYDRTHNRISGQWYDEDTVAHSLDFLAADPDTISGLQPRTKPYLYRKPDQKQDGLAVSTLTDLKLNKTAIDTLITRIIKGHYKNIHSLLIALDDSLVIEEYFYRFDQDFVYNIQSATKSIVSALAGIAIDNGEIKSVNEKLCTYLKGYEKVACNDQNKAITLRHLLTMNTGIPWNEQQYDYGDERNSLSVASNQRDQFEYLLSLPRPEKDSQIFAYNSLNHILMNAVLRQATHLENDEELKNRLLKPLGIEKSYIGEPTPMGAIGDIGLRPRDMMKFGVLYLNNGNWHGQQLVPSWWVKESTSTKISVTPTLGYGYFWWTRSFSVKGKNTSAFFAWGYGGQYIVVIPATETVVVMSGSHWGTNPEEQMVEIMEEILAALV